MNELAFPEPEDFVANQAFLRRLAASLVRDPSAADDLVQDTWTAWAERAPRGLSSPRAWLARVLRNRATNVQRETERRARREARNGRPEGVDPGAEAGALLEVQARVVAALRALEEPYRSTLVLRYFHELGPQAIAARTQTSVNTVKARLARGLEKLRHELDRRSGGERGAWCHWLLCLGPDPALPIPAPGGPRAALERSSPHAPGGAAGAPAGAWLGSWSAVSAWVAGVVVLTCAIVCVVWWPRDEARVESPTVRAAEEPDRALLFEPSQRVPLAVDGKPQQSAVVTDGVVRRWFEPPWLHWPQYAGRSSHDNSRTGRTDIRRPRVLWRVAGAHGQPTGLDRDIYSGGDALVRVDPRSGAVVARVLEKDATSPAGPAVAASPVVTDERVIARWIQDGSVIAFDRSLERELWRFTPEDPALAGRSGCLVDEELFVFAHGSQVIALRVFDGAVVWRFWTDTGDDVDMIPAADEEVVYFGTENGVVFAVLTRGGLELWRAETGGRLGGSHPVVVDGLVVLADRGATPGSAPNLANGERGGRVWALAADDGRVRWKTEHGTGPCSMLGVGRDDEARRPSPRFFVVGGFETLVARFDLESGAIDQRTLLGTQRSPLGMPAVLDHSLVFGGLEGSLRVHALDSGALRWAFQLPPLGAVHDLVPWRDALFVATSEGLFCLVDEGEKEPAPAGFVLEWKGEGRAPESATGR